VKPASATPQTFILTGPDQSAIQTKVTAAEGGRLVFVVPASPLQPGTTYVLRINGATDVNGNPLQESLITFETEGEPLDGTGPDWVPNANWTDPGGNTRFQQRMATGACHPGDERKESPH
jgi:hypothetical protein